MVSLSWSRWCPTPTSWLSDSKRDVCGYCPTWLVKRCIALGISDEWGLVFCVRKLPSPAIAVSLSKKGYWGAKLPALRLLLCYFSVDDWEVGLFTVLALSNFSRLNGSFPTCWGDRHLNLINVRGSKVGLLELLILRSTWQHNSTSYSFVVCSLSLAVVAP